MRKTLTFLLCLLSLCTFGQETKAEFNGPEWNPPYYLAMENWGIERFPFPISFAPQIPYQGVEDIRFTAGWGDIKSQNYWTYAFIWCLDSNPKINISAIEKNLNAYYNGLVQRNIEKRNIPADKLIPVKTRIKKAKTEQGDLQTFYGTIDMLDYMSQNPITLNCIIHLLKCAQGTKTILFHQISPKPFSDPVWLPVRKLKTDFSCK